MEPDLASAPALMHRVARRSGLLRFSEITPQDAELASAGNRFDVPGGAVLYTATSREACFAETLSRFRPTARIRDLVKDETGFMVTGGVPQDWRLQRAVADIRTPTALPFLDVESPATQEFLNTRLAGELVALGYEGNLDISTLCNQDRRLSRAIARHAYTATDEDGTHLYSGIRYVSRIDPRWECWAVFDGTEIDLAAHHAIGLEDPDITTVADMWGLRIF